MRDVDRDGAAAFLDALEDRLDAVAADPELGAELELQRTEVSGGEGSSCRLVYRCRDGCAWILAVC